MPPGPGRRPGEACAPQPGRRKQKNAVELGGGKVAEACQSLADLVVGRKILHADESLLNARIGAAQKLASGDGWRFTRRGGRRARRRRLRRRRGRRPNYRGSQPESGSSPIEAVSAPYRAPKWCRAPLRYWDMSYRLVQPPLHVPIATSRPTLAGPAVHILLGDLPTWIAAIAAIVAGIIAYRVYKIESGRDQQAALNTRRAQASQIAAWYGLGESDKWGGFLRSRSELPVYNVVISFNHLVSDASGEIFSIYSVVMSVLPPGADRFIPLDESVIELLRLNQEPPMYAAVQRSFIEVEFTDSNGIRWRRGREGQLTEPTS